MLRQIVEDRRFSLADLTLVILSGVIRIIKPELVFWFILIALLPWMIRLIAGKFPFQPARFDWLIGVFFITAWVACFIGYDKSAAYEKFYFILVSILLYFSLSNQPKENIEFISALLFVLGVIISIYFLLTGKDEIKNVFIQWMTLRTHMKWIPIPSGYVPGLAFITVPFIVERFNASRKPSSLLLKLAMVFGLLIVFTSVILATSLSVWFALLGSIAVWLLWKMFNLTVMKQLKRINFPLLVLIYLVFVITILYTIGPATSSSPNFFGTNSRREVLSRSSYFLFDYPILGAGLAAFPGLYSQYMLGIPYYYFSNSYNLFLDVAIEQGLAGGIAILVLYLIHLAQAARKIQNDNSSAIQSWLALFVVMFASIHGMVQNYLYNSAGTVLLLLPVGMSALLTRASGNTVLPQKNVFAPRQKLILIILGTILFAGILLNRNKLASYWYANLGAVQLAQVELAGFPDSGWLGLGVVPKLEKADASLQDSLRLDPTNLTAHYRLGLINMLRRDFVEASKHLEIAYARAPHHRGIVKSLGYCYLWMGETDKAYALLAVIPEARQELDAYYWWWQNQDREDLSKMAYIMIRQLDPTTTQP